MDRNTFENLKEQHPDFFNKLDPDLVDYAVSEEFSTAIARACLLSNLESADKIEVIAYWTTWALFGAIPEESLIDLFEKKIGLDNDTASDIYQAIDELIFSQLEEEDIVEPNLSIETEEKTPPLKTQKKIARKDIYRESAN